jgi:hypothetical protein
MSVRLRDTSRLRWARLLTIDGMEFWEQPEYPEIGEAPDDMAYEVSRTDRIDRIAFNFYRSTDLWWIIALRNDLRLLPDDMYEGRIIQIPSNRRVYNTILRSPSRGKEGKG